MCSRMSANDPKQTFRQASSPPPGIAGSWMICVGGPARNGKLKRGENLHLDRAPSHSNNSRLLRSGISPTGLQAVDIFGVPEGFGLLPRKYAANSQEGINQWFTPIEVSWLPSQWLLPHCSQQQVPLQAPTSDHPPAAPPPSQWQFSFTPYAWLPWISGDVVVKGRTLDVAVDPAQIIDYLNWPDIVPAWMSHAEARRGPLSLFNDIVWADLAGSEGFTRKFRGRLATATFGGDVSVDYKLAHRRSGGCLRNLVARQPRFPWLHSLRSSCRRTLLAPRGRCLC